MIMNDIDEKTLEALNNEDKKVMDSFGEEPGLFDLIAESFRGKMKAVVIPCFVFMLAFAVLLVYSAIHFFSVEDIGTRLHWLAIGFTALIVFGLLRLWYWMELNRLSVIREVKRLELQISLLSKKL
jgi:fucose 4-O-acetylase-like acetyltransferase